MRAKRFFYVCAGILVLTIAYGLGAHHAVAQSGPRIVDVAATPPVGGGLTHLWVLDSLGRIYMNMKAETVDPQLIQVGTAPEEAVAIGGPIGDRLWVGMVNGNVYEFSGRAGTWTLLQNVFDGSVQAMGTNWSNIKKHYKRAGDDPKAYRDHGSDRFDSV